MHKIEHNGIVDSVAGWARRVGMSRTTLKERLRLGWSIAEALTAPIDPHVQRRNGVIHKGRDLGRRRAYVSWRAMHERCPAGGGGSRFHGARGIRVCERWQSFANFFADMGPRPAGTTIDRIDAAGNYEPSNCRWATPKEQAMHLGGQRATRVLVIGSEHDSVSGWCKRSGTARDTILKRLAMGWDPERAVWEPSSAKHRAAARARHGLTL